MAQPAVRFSLLFVILVRRSVWRNWYSNPNFFKPAPLYAPFMKACYLLTSFILLFSVFTGYGQIDSSRKFEIEKGNLNYPVSKVFEIETYTKAKSVIYETEPSKSIGFVVDSEEKVFACYEGQVVAVQQVEDMYVVIVKFGRYILTYSGLCKPEFGKGYYLKKGEFISYVQRDVDEKFRLSLWLSDFENHIDPDPWFRK